jgi:hypothetical protein
MPAQNYVLLERVEVGAAGASRITFNSIPQTGYTDLKVVYSARITAADVNIGMRINGSSSSIYSGRYLQGTGSGTASGSWSAANRDNFVIANSSAYTASTFSNCEIYFPNYTSSNNKSYSVDEVTENNATAAVMFLNAGLFSSTSAISSLSFFYTDSSNDIAQYSTFSLYGLAAVGTTPTRAPKASGGSIIQTDGTYWYHAFLASGTFTPAVGLSCDVLVVAGAGGGSAASGSGAGGGAGGLLAFTSQSVSTATTVTVGGGGAGSPASTSGTGSGTVGVDSQFGALTLVKGGGAGRANPVGGNGGSGGGAADALATAGGTATSGQGSNGGYTTSWSGNYGAGAGGGATTAGGNGNATKSGDGGAGSSAYSSWGLATATGQNVSGTVWYAGGGAGGARNSGSGGTGGNGGGAVGSSTSTGTNGTPNTGGGGSGAGGTTGNAAGGAGGSGIIIVRYLA